MKINKIEIYGFGKWNNVSFDLRQNLHVFYGLNEAGKSTIRQFIYSVLFGFAAGRGSNKYLQYIPKKAVGYGGVLTLEHEDQEYNVERVKGKNGGKVSIKRVGDGAELPTEFLTQILGKVDQTTYQQLLGFNQSELDEFNDLGNRDDLRRHILKMGAVGSDEWIKLENDLKKEANKMYTTSSRTRELDQKITGYQEAAKQLQEDKDKLPDYQSTKKLEEKSKQQLEEIRVQIKALSVQDAKITKQLDAWPTYTEILKLRAQLEKVPDDHLRLNLNQIEMAANKIQEVENDLQVLQQKIKKLAVDDYAQNDSKNLLKLQARLPEVKLNYGQLDDLNKRIQRLNQQIIEIEDQYEVSISDMTPMNEENFSEFKELILKQKRVTAEINQLKNQMLETTKTKSKGIGVNPIIILGIVAILAVVDFLLPLNILFKVLILSAITGVGYLTTRSDKTHQTQGETLQDVLHNNEDELSKIEFEIQKIGSQTGFESVPVEEWSGLQNNLQNHAHLQNEIKELKEHLKMVTGQIEDFWEFSDMVKLSERHDQSMLDELSQNVEQAIRQVQVHQEQTQQHKVLTASLEEKKQILDKLKADFDRFDVPELNNSFFEWVKDVRQEQALELRLKTIEASLQPTIIKELSKFDNVDTLKQQQNEQITKMTELKQMEQEILDQRSNQIGELTGLKNSLDILDEQQLLSEQKTEIKDLISEWLTLQLGAEWVDQTLGVATKGRLPLIIEQANSYFSEITNQRYQKIEFDQNDQIRVMDTENNVFEIGELSKGTMEQLYVAIRFAFMQAFADTLQLPIVIDDAFVAFDDIRLKQAFDLLEKISKKTQIIYFSAKKEIYNLVDHAEITNLNEQ